MRSSYLLRPQRIIERKGLDQIQIWKAQPFCSPVNQKQLTTKNKCQTPIVLQTSKQIEWKTKFPFINFKTKIKTKYLPEILELTARNGSRDARTIKFICRQLLRYLRVFCNGLWFRVRAEWAVGALIGGWKWLSRVEVTLRRCLKKYTLLTGISQQRTPIALSWA